MAIIGIDLGTTNSLGTIFKDNKVTFIPNQHGSILTPSVVSMLEDGTIVVGELAKQRLITHPEQTAASFKKDMGTTKKYRLGKQDFLPEELSSFLVRSIVEDAKRFSGEEIEEVIISVPAYFHDKQRVATKRAGTLAGVEVKRIINEPSAAAMASYFDTNKEELFLVFDFGGGTLDVSLVECFDTMVEILSVSGDNRLGGDNFHSTMVEHFLQEHDLNQNLISEKEYSILIHQAELCKQRLTTEPEAQMSMVLHGHTYRSIYTNERLLQESATILSRIKQVLTHALRDGDIPISEIHAIILAGGSSRMPLIQSFLQHLFPNTPVVAGDYDQMIAKGLGLICAIKQRKEDMKDYILTDICPFTLGTATYNDADPNHSYMTPIIPRNTVLPCSRVKRFYTSYENQTSIGIEILQGEHPYADDNLLLDKVTLPVPRNKKGAEAADVRFTYDINGILIVDVTVISTGKVVSKTISQTMNPQEIAKRVSELEKLKIHPKDLSENHLMMEKLQALFETSPIYLREQLAAFIQNFELLLSRQDPRAIKHYRRFLENVITQIHEYDPFAQQMTLNEYNEEDWENEEDSSEEENTENIYWEEGTKKWTS